MIRSLLIANRGEIACRRARTDRRPWDGGIIDPVQTRDALGLAFSACLNAPDPGAGALRRVQDVAITER